MATYLIVITSDHLTRGLIVSFPFCIGGGGVGSGGGGRGVDKSLSVAAFLFCSLPKIELNYEAAERDFAYTGSLCFNTQAFARTILS